jgi:hypothetical protein
VCFDFFDKFVRNISHCTKNWARYDQRSILVFMSSTRYSCQILMNLEFSRQIFDTYSNFIKFRSVRAEVFRADRQKARRTDMTKLIVAFSNFARTPKKGKV